MAKDRILLLGASGFIGQLLVSSLVDAGFIVRAAIRRPILFARPVEIATISDFMYGVAWRDHLIDVDIVVHAAGLAHVEEGDQAYAVYDRVNRAATEELVRAAKQFDIKRFVYISTVRAQIGSSAAHTVREEDEPLPTDSYGRSKLAAELAVRASGIPFTILRPVVVYGPNAKGNFHLLSRLASLPIPLPFAGLNNRRSLLGISNLNSAILFAIDIEAAINQTYLVADQTPLSVAEIVTQLRKAMGRGPGLIYVPPRLLQIALYLIRRRSLWDRLGGDLVVDTSKLQELGWRADVDTYSGFAAMLQQQGLRGNAGQTHPV